MNILLAILAIFATIFFAKSKLYERDLKRLKTKNLQDEAERATAKLESYGNTLDERIKKAKEEYEKNSRNLRDS